MLFTTNRNEAFKVTKEEAALFKVFNHIDSSIDEGTLEALDNLFIKLKNSPNIHELLYTDENGQRMAVFLIGYNGDTYIDYNAYLTWSNTFHLRHAAAFTAINQHGERFISPENSFNLARYLIENPTYKPLKLEQVI